MSLGTICRLTWRIPQAVISTGEVFFCRTLIAIIHHLMTCDLDWPYVDKNGQLTKGAVIMRGPSFLVAAFGSILVLRGWNQFHQDIVVGLLLLFLLR